ncbi:unnamed protein product [Penicillium salamii]|uniref:Transmembrane protein n=1 Tax=Penicillium salamii TaxID=1612424 RepID=A0A9W4IHT6_9EURO|nr:unnamed protein product [Penicillium salamii]CAG8082477.1 unnamed protein product [Penicillium salamii]CAG8099385.1 unnamed protein product [Penicillium salamii]CAG8106982.1 unnamed protein product [Penicillium salamii]CAG8115604.1 unnamed protein product [Penicillium salamii]
MAFFPFNLRCSAVILMISALLIALAFAVGHDALYQSLNRKPVLHVEPLFTINSIQLSDQQVYVSLGTLFAFLVKSCLGVSVSTAFDQFAWKSIHGQTTKIAVIDDLFSVLKHGFTLLDPRLWRHYPLSMTLAAMCWLLPVPSILTPATLSVKLAPLDEVVLQRIPRVDFATANFVNLIRSYERDAGSLGRQWMKVYSGPTPDVQRIVYGAATQGKVLAIDPAAANSSWLQEFHGPALVCGEVNQTLRAILTRNIATAINASKTNDNGSGFKVSSYTGYLYLSWAPAGEDPVNVVPFYQPEHNGSYVLQARQIGPDPWATGGTEDTWLSTASEPIQKRSPLSVFVASFPRMAHNVDIDNLDAALQNSTIVQCFLHNATYQASFEYVNGNQTVHVTDQKILDGISLLGGIEGVVSQNQSSFIQNPQIMESMAYQSVMDAFCGLLYGYIGTNIFKANNDTVPGYASTPSRAHTDVTSTILMETEELHQLKANLISGGNDSYIDYWRGRSMSSLDQPLTPLATTIQDLFRNTTISFMSSSLFQPNYSTTTVPNTNVTISTYRNIYNYSRLTLWVTYGIALGVTLLSVIAGVLVWLSSQGSYSSKFSTILRISQGATISVKLEKEDYSGFDPLPDHIANAQLRPGYGSQETTSEMVAAESRPSTELLSSGLDEEHQNC